jgi:hypothetical protein
LHPVASIGEDIPDEEVTPAMLGRMPSKREQRLRRLNKSAA